MTNIFQYVNQAKGYMSFLCLACLFVAPRVSAQITYNKRLAGPIGEAPKVSTFSSSSYSVDNVERSTGTVNINIPLYEIKAHDIKVPISISYSAQGLKVGQEAGAPGMGWELNAGGKIIKQINGLDDETAPSSLNSTSIFTLDPNNSANDRTTFRQIAAGEKDFAFDTYSYSVPGGSGRFTRNGLTFPYDPTFSYNSANRQITTGDGLIHSFQQGDVLLVNKRKFYKQKSDGTYNMEEVPTALQWVQDIKEQKSDYNLTMITSSRSKDTVKFEYEVLQSAGPMSGIIGRSRTTTTEQLSLGREMMHTSYLQPNGSLAYYWADKYGGYYFLSEPVIAQTKIDVVSHQRIKRILYATGKVEFEYRSEDLLGRDVLKKIKIYQRVNGVYKRLKQYQFNYDSELQYGHYLKDVDILDADSVRAGLWKFDYNGYPGNGVVGKRTIAPNVESNAQDRWGFYNGVSGNKTLIENPENMINLNDRPHYSACIKDNPGSASAYFMASRPETIQHYSGQISITPYAVNFANRNTVFSHMIAGTISKVTTPLGETVNYEYESNKFYVSGASPSYAKTYEGGGIRIKSITRNDGAPFVGKTLSKKSFTYGVGSMNSPANTEIGYGIVNIPGVISSVAQQYEYNGLASTIETQMLYSHPLNDLALYNGSAAFYPSVTESTHTGPNITHQTVYYFDYTVPTGPWTNLPIGSITYQYFPARYNNFGIKRHTSLGQPLQIIEYNGLRSGNTKARVTVNAYSNYEAPADSPKMHSYFGGINAAKISESNTYLMVCGPVTGTNGMSFQCTRFATVQNMDPLGYQAMGPEVADTWYDGKYFGERIEYSSLSNVCKQTGTTTTTYNTIYVDPFVTTTTTSYDNILHMQPSSIMSQTSKGAPMITTFKYAKDALMNTVPGVDLLIQKNILTEPVEQLEIVSPTYAQVLRGIKNVYTGSGDLVLNSGTYRLNTGGKTMALSAYSISSSDYEAEYSFNSPDQMGNPTLVKRANGTTTGVIWGYNQQYPVAEVTNIYSMDDIAFTNFQSDNRPEWKGYWSYSGIPELDVSSPSADMVYKLQNGPITKTLPSTGKKFLLAYWYKLGTTVTVTGVTAGPEVIKNTKGSWVFAEREITSGTALSITGTGYIDELRLCPAESMMKTFTYNPGVGISRIQDARGISSTYEYDSEQHLKAIRDQQGNILKAYDYHIGDGYKQTVINNN